MAARLRFDFDGSSLQRLEGNVKRYSKGKDRELKALVLKYLTLVEGTAKTLAPVNKDPKITGGFLRREIRHEFEPETITGFVEARAFYSIFQELGTGRRGAASNVPPVEDYDYGPSAGVPAQPFLNPALEMHTPPFLRELQRILSRR